MDVLTYEQVREAEREERGKTVLTNLGPDFINRFHAYLTNKRAVLEKSDDNLIAEKMKEQSQKELINARKSFNNLFRLRANKLIEQAFIDVKMGTEVNDKKMLDFEKVFYQDFKELLIKHLQNITKRKIKKEDLIKKKSNNNKLVRFVKEMPEFAWGEGVLGPFSKEDVVNLPNEAVELLRDKGAVEVI